MQNINTITDICIKCQNNVLIYNCPHQEFPACNAIRMYCGQGTQICPFRLHQGFGGQVGLGVTMPPAGIEPTLRA